MLGIPSRVAVAGWGPGSLMSQLTSTPKAAPPGVPGGYGCMEMTWTWHGNDMEMRANPSFWSRCSKSTGVPSSAIAVKPRSGWPLWRPGWSSSAMPRIYRVEKARPLMGLEKAHVALLDDWRFNEDVSYSLVQRCTFHPGSAIESFPTSAWPGSHMPQASMLIRFQEQWLHSPVWISTSFMVTAKDR